MLENCDSWKQPVAANLDIYNSILTRKVLVEKHSLIITERLAKQIETVLLNKMEARAGEIALELRLAGDLTRYKIKNGNPFSGIS